MKPNDGKTGRLSFLLGLYFSSTAFLVVFLNPPYFAQTKFHGKQTWERVLTVERHRDRNQPDEAHENKNLKELFVR